MPPTTQAAHPKEHIHDIVMVHNIWTDAPEDLVIEDYTQQTVPVPGTEEPTTGIRQQQFQQIVHRFRPSECFEIRWNGRTHRIMAGEKRALPRYLAEHFANKLADQILGMQDPKGTLGYVNSSTRRPELIDQILIEVVSWHNDADLPDNANDAAIERAKQYNDASAIDNGQIPSNRYGNLRPEKTPVQAGQSEAPKADEDPFGKRTKEQLLKEAVDLGLDVTGKETKAEIIDKIKQNFA